jgi:RNA polymerase sigma-70 factor, ECF subfamily
MLKPDIAADNISLTALRDGDRAEFAHLVERYSTQVYALALRMLGDPQDAEDVLQETFLKAFRAIRNFEGRSRLSTWLYRIAINESLMRLRKARKEPLSIDSHDEDEEDENESLQIVDWSGLPEDKLLSAESRKMMDKAVQTLSPALRAVFLLRDVQELSIRETGEALDLNEAVVKTRLSRARFYLRNELSKYYKENENKG